MAMMTAQMEGAFTTLAKAIMAGNDRQGAHSLDLGPCASTQDDEPVAIRGRDPEEERLTEEAIRIGNDLQGVYLVNAANW